MDGDKAVAMGEGCSLNRSLTGSLSRQAICERRGLTTHTEMTALSRAESRSEQFEEKQKIRLEILPKGFLPL